jgi:hypothetical protein
MANAPADGNSTEGKTDEAFEALLRYMRDSRGFDFTGYKRTSLMRRVRHRMDQAGYTSFEEYLDVLLATDASRVEAPLSERLGFAQATAAVRRQFQVHSLRSDDHLPGHEGLPVLRPADPMGRLPAQDGRQDTAGACEVLLDHHGSRKLRW